jgi:hypothetical protein
MSFDPQTLAALKEQETKHSRVEWSQAFKTARQSLKYRDARNKDLRLIALASSSPAKFTTVTRLMYQYSKLHPLNPPVGEVLLQEVDQSPYSMGDWIDTIDRFHNWLSDRERKVDFLAMLNYLDCCAASSEATEGGQKFSEVLDFMLQVFGYFG